MWTNEQIEAYEAELNYQESLVIKALSLGYLTFDEVADFVFLQNPAAYDADYVREAYNANSSSKTV